MKRRRLSLRHALNDHLDLWSCHLTARHGAQVFADVSVAHRVVLERSVVESAGFFADET